MLGKMGLRPFSIYEINDLTKGEPDSPRIVSFKMRPKDGQGFNFVPGMFSSLFLNPSDKLFRSYSIASSPTDDHMEFMIELINGRFTSQLAKLKEGDEIFISEPRGAFIYEPNGVHGDLFLAAGIGIAPFFSMLRYVKNRNMKRNIYLFYSVKHKEDIVNLSELEEYKGLGLNIVFTVTRDPENAFWKGEHGRINMQMIQNHVTDFVSRTIYLCGGIKFVKDIVEELKAKGIKDDEIKRDIWGE
ncbi:MAG: FAD-binding oxidoreductase [Thermoplasmatales archaeon]|nr:FAD-binding oxidoreductase [Candidatus Thermoplasmatota archaeon]MCL6003575.1 FAD-binding oxidoreductase [Candidatus Thermoplasmatota archaeon]MDA8054246.1 FAD-binding oxidoreductase [Thermoplasmatales archaeon]